MRFQIFRDKAGEWRWRLTAKNHEIIATSGEGYKRILSCVEIVEKLQDEIGDASVELPSRNERNGNGADETQKEDE